MDSSKKFRLVAYFNAFAVVEDLENEEQLAQRVEELSIKGHTDNTHSEKYITIYPPTTLQKIVVFRYPLA